MIWLGIGIGVVVGSAIVLICVGAWLARGFRL